MEKVMVVDVGGVGYGKNQSVRPSEISQSALASFIVSRYFTCGSHMITRASPPTPTTTSPAPTASCRRLSPCVAGTAHNFKYFGPCFDVVHFLQRLTICNRVLQEVTF
ncbi:unnamed protein product [Prunus brigantina]